MIKPIALVLVLTMLGVFIGMVAVGGIWGLSHTQMPSPRAACGL
jgi:hypothetical protein